tara:strand:+ start:23001 stop:23159 length:159 start_codon:yes stop_codon:yes gene_type:complete
MISCKFGTIYAKNQGKLALMVPKKAILEVFSGNLALLLPIFQEVWHLDGQIS